IPPPPVPFLRSRSRLLAIGAIGTVSVIALIFGLVKLTGSSDASDAKLTTLAEGKQDGLASMPTSVVPPNVAVRLLRVESEPTGPIVRENGRELCTTTPCRVTWLGDEASAQHKLAIEKPGFKTATIPIEDGQERVVAKLEFSMVGSNDSRPSDNATPGPTS